MFSFATFSHDFVLMFGSSRVVLFFKNPSNFTSVTFSCQLFLIVCTFFWHMCLPFLGSKFFDRKTFLIFEKNENV